MKIDVKSAVADILKLEETEFVFGYTGGHIMHMWEASHNAGIKLILNKQEGNAVYMADAYARITKKASIVLGTAGPGVTNMTTGLATALLDSTPLIAIGAGVATTAFGKNAVQDGSGRGRATEQRMAMKSVCKQAMLAPTPDAVPDMIREAFREALSGRPGPVYVEIPSNFWDIQIEYEKIPPHKYKNLHLPECNQEDKEIIWKSLYKAKRPLILIGEGAFEKDIQHKLMKFINAVGIPFATSPLGKNCVDEFHSMYLGVARLEGKTQKVYEYINGSDFVLFLGDRMQEWEVAWYSKTLFLNKKLAQVDPDWNEIGRVYPIDYSAVGSISSFIENESFKKHSQSLVLSQEVKSLWKTYPLHGILPDGNGVNPLNINTVVQKNADPLATIVTDTGYAKSMAIIKYFTHVGQHFISADKNGPMGYSVPAALGAALATNKQVICFVGDGGFQMSLNELGTTLNYNLKVIYIIEDNGGCCSIVDFHNSVYGHHVAETFQNPNFVKLAEAYGMRGFSVNTTKGFEKAFIEATKCKTSVIIDVKIDQSTMVWE